MTVLRDCAKKLASDPPIALYERLMKLITDEQIYQLDQQLIDIEKKQNSKEKDKERDQVEETKKACRAAAHQYTNNKKIYGQGIADFSVTAICDFAAMCMMMIAAGVDRVEHLKARLLGQKATTTYERDNGDRAYLFLRGEGKKFREIMDEWPSREGKSIVQFKFPAGGDLHTFAAERFTHPLGLEPYFYMYQAYQNTYSLSHFLGLKSVWNDEALNKFLEEVIWGQQIPATKKRYNNDYKTYWTKVLKGHLDQIDTLAKVLGGAEGQGLDRELFRTAVIKSLASMLDAELDRERYAALTGSHTTNNVRSDYMMVLICDKLDPNVFESNLKSLYGPPQNVTKYLECSVGT
jgi:hypothetical protein